MTLRRPLDWAEGRDYESDSAGCWLWLGWKDRQGYGRCHRTPERRAHREAYRQAYGNVPADMDVHHRCDNPPCVNPAHLELRSRSAHLALHKQKDSPLTWDDVREIRRLVQEGARPVELTARFRISRESIGQIALNRSWKDPAYVPERERVCPECGEAFYTSKPNKRFCCAKHRRAWNSRHGFQRRKAAA